MNNENTITNILFVALIFAIVLFVILILIYIILSIKIKNSVKIEEVELDKNKKSKKNKKIEKNKEEQQTIAKVYSQKSIYDFMEFEEIQDNMIVQKGGKRYIMVVECQGVNYDLMAGLEKISVEEGFQQFLNSLRHPIQIYIQTRTINLEKSIQKYKEQVNQIENNYNKRLQEYNQMIKSETYDKEDLEKQFFELTKQKNMLEYGKDIVNNTEQMSLNKSILNKKYYIIIPYYPEEVATGKYTVEELRNMAFSELYTKSQAIMRTLSACSVTGKILTSMELIELLYVAYNRDESEIFGVERAMKAGFEDLYSTAPDIFEKKIRILDKKIEEQAISKANAKIEKAKTRLQQKVEKKEENIDNLINEMAELILEENKAYIGEEIVEEAIKEIKEEGGEDEDEIKKKTARGRKKKTA